MDIKFLNVDLEIESSADLSPLVPQPIDDLASRDGGGYLRHVGRGRPPLIRMMS